MKLILALASMLLVCAALFAFAHGRAAVAQQQAAEPAPPAGKDDQADSNSEDQRPQPPPHLAKIERLTEADEDGITWGESHNGLAIGFGKIETSLKSPLRPAIEVYLENRGAQTIARNVLSKAIFELKLNEEKHTFSRLNPFFGTNNQLRVNVPLDPGKRYGPLMLTTDQFRVIHAVQLGPVLNLDRPGPVLAEGNHTLHVDFRLPGAKAESASSASAAVDFKVSLSPYPVEEAVAMVRDGLKDENLGVRRNSAILAGWLKLSACRDVLMKALNDEDTYLRRYAMKSLGDLKDPAAIEPLKEQLQDQRMDIRLQAARSLTDLGVPLQPHWLEPIIKSKRTSDYQGAIMLAREKLGKKAVPLLIRCLEFDDPSVRNYYNYLLVQQIGACGGPSYTYHRNRRRNGGTRQEVAHNQRVLLDLKALVIEDL